MTDPITPPVFARARLRRDSPAAALARILVPEEPGRRLGAAHSLVWALFADGPERRRDFLWREMRPGELLILAARMPADPHNLFDLECKPFAPVLRPGQRLRFDLRANPVIAVPDPQKPGRRGERSDVVMHAIYDIAKTERADGQRGGGSPCRRILARQKGRSGGLRHR